MRFNSLTQKLSAHLSRWLVALILIPPVIILTVVDQPLFFGGLVLVGGGLVWAEFFLNVLGPERRWFMALSLAGWLAVIAGAQCFGPQGQQAGLLAALGLGALYALVNLPKISGPLMLNLLGRYALGHLYLSLGLSFLPLLRLLPDGVRWVLYLFLVTVVADTAAFYVGSTLKGPKLYPAASPNKTLSGLAGGVLSAMLISALSSLFLPAPAGRLIVLGLVIGLAAAFGDLFESALKRALSIKDSSKFLLGHGGFWDRLDGLIFTGGPVYLLVTLWVAP